VVLAAAGNQEKATPLGPVNVIAHRI